MKILPHEIVYAITFFFTGGLILVAWPRRHTTGGWFFIGQLLALLIWVLGLFFEAISTTLPAKILWSQIAYFGFTPAISLFFLFVLAYTQQTKIRASIIVSVFILPAIVLLAVWTNQWHHLVWTGFEWGDPRYNILIYHHGFLYFLFMIYIYILALYGLAILIRKIRQSEPPFRSQLIIITISSLFPIISGSLYAFNVALVPGMDTSPFGFLLTNIALAFGFSSFQLLDLVPVARDVLIKQVQDGLVVIDWQNRIVEINQSAKTLLGLKGNDLLGKNFQELLPWSIDPKKLSYRNQPTEFSLSESAKKYLDLQVSSLVPHSETPSGYLLVFRDISARKQIELQLQTANTALHEQIDEINHLQSLLQEQATHDSLTGLHNRRLIDEILTQQVEKARVHGQPYSLLIMDIDHFKNINDDFGHQAGDAILEKFGTCILGSTRSIDFSCRLGGDEILIAFQNMALTEAKKKANLLRKKLEAIVLKKDDQTVRATVSIGIATFPAHGENVEGLMSRADKAMYLAKERGRNQVVTAEELPEFQAEG